ncbi:MAG TPA: hydrogenase maturation protease [Terriglobales bacterium]
MARALVVGLGNRLRSDDGLGWHVAERLSREYAPEVVQVLGLHQLTPEAAEVVSRAELVIFVDASCEGHAGTVSCTRIEPGAPAGGSSHEFSPAAVLRLAEELYGRAPAAYLLTVAGESFEVGEGLSAVVVRGIPLLMERIRELIGEKASGDSG